MLSNFPIKYLDNDYFRTKYFSHKINKNNTRLFGFGFNKLNDENKKKESTVNTYISKRKMIKFGLKSFGAKFYTKATPNENYSLINIPAIKLIIEMLITFIKA